MAFYTVYLMKDLSVIIAHFDNYPLLTQKRADFELFKQIFELISRKEHLTTKGLEKLIVIKAPMNNGLSTALKAAFPNIIPASRPLIVDQEIKDPNWLAGFTEGEGCLLIIIQKYSASKSGYQVRLRFSLTQHSRDEKLLKSLVEYLGSGIYYACSEHNLSEFVVIKFADLTDKIIPFFDKYPIVGAKRQDYLDFCKVAELMRSKAHLTSSGLEQIKQIKSGMNRGRSFD